MQTKKNSAWFALVFIALLLAISTGVFFTFSYYQRTLAEGRRQISADHLESIHKVLAAYKKNVGRLPTTPAELAAVFKGHTQILIHPAWPEQPGYVYVCGPANAGEDISALLVFENVPDRKRKLGRQSVNEAGTVTFWKEDNDFNALLSATEALCKQRSIQWRLIEIRAE